MSESEPTPPMKPASGMRSIVCKICSKIYSERNPPLIMPCGHSCCTSCLAQIINTSKICHVCKRVLMHLDVSHYPINYAVLEVSEECSSVNNFRKRTELVYKSHQMILSAAESLVSEVMANKDQVKEMQLNVPKLLELIATDDEALNVKAADATLDNIERLMKEVAEIFQFKNEIVLEGEPKTVAPFLLPPTTKNTEFISKIQTEIYNNNTRFVAHQTINGVDCFAKISIDGPSILLHSFRGASPKFGATEPGDGHFTYFPKEGQAKVVKFEDFKNASRWMKQRAFIDVNRKRLFIDLVSQSVCSYSFLQLCTGEVGSSYLNGIYDQSRNIRVFNTNSTWNWNNLYLENFLGLDSYFNCDSERTYAKFNVDGSINIMEGLCGNNTNICGVLVNPEIPSDIRISKVTDCGIAYRLALKVQTKTPNVSIFKGGTLRPWAPA